MSSNAPLSLSSKEELKGFLQKALLGRYEVYDELGSGGMATVFLAHDIALDREVAIKVMLPVLLLSDGMTERFKREARTAASLSHPNIIPVHAVGEEGQLLYFVMKHVAGRGLDGVLHETGSLPVEMVEAILGQVGSAIAYAHRKGVIHRDIKPANIMLDENGWAVVTDFGIAKTAQAVGLTTVGGLVGTPLYMSPEQFAGEPASRLSDQYSLGVVAFEMLTGRLPFQGRSLGEVARAQILVKAPDLLALRPDCPPALAGVVMRMIEQAPADRFGDVDDVVAQLKAEGGHGHSDSVRTRMLALAKNGPPRVEIPPPPTSPVPQNRPSQQMVRNGKPPAPGRGAIGFTVGLIAAGAALSAWLVLRQTPFEEVVDPTGGRPAAGWIQLGTRHGSASVYFNGSPQLPKGPSLRWWEVPVGNLAIEIRAEGCQSWRETRVIATGDSVRIGDRAPSCGGPP